MKTEPIWKPLPRQRIAYKNPADELFYGGAAGGGKSDLLLGLALYEHQRSIIFRREYEQLKAMLDRAHELYEPYGKFHGTHKRWHQFADPKKIIEFGACQYEKDQENYQGRPHDFKAFDEITQFTEKMFRFLITWRRTTIEGQRTRCVVAGNPPLDAEGEWVLRYWGAWIDEDHPQYPTKPGQLRWYTTGPEGIDIEVESGERLLIKGEYVKPKSRTFIPARIEDNPYLIATDYKSTLQGLPEPMRSKMLKGDFSAGARDKKDQVIPSEWVKLAQERWRTLKKPSVPLSHVGVDVARGGRDRTVITLRHGAFITRQIVIKGSDTPNSTVIIGHIQAVMNVECIINVDVIGVGAAVFDGLISSKKLAVPLMSSARSLRRDRTKRLTFYNKRAEWWWHLREILDPEHGENIAIPDDAELRRELCTPIWKHTTRGVQIESKEAIIKRIHKSTDKADSMVYAFAQEEPTKVRFANIGFMGR